MLEIVRLNFEKAVGCGRACWQKKQAHCKVPGLAAMRDNRDTPFMVGSIDRIVRSVVVL